RSGCSPCFTDSGAANEGTVPRLQVLDRNEVSEHAQRAVPRAHPWIFNRDVGSPRGPHDQPLTRERHPPCTNVVLDVESPSLLAMQHGDLERDGGRAIGFGGIVEWSLGHGALRNSSIGRRGRALREK